MDVLTDVLETVRFRAAVTVLMRLRAPWAFSGARDDRAHFYLVSTGEAVVTLANPRASIRLGEGDVLLVGRGVVHELHDVSQTSTRGRREARWPAAGVLEIDGPGALTEVVSGCLGFDDSGTPLWSALPRVIHATSVDASPFLRETARFMVQEAMAAGPGSQAVLFRLADVLVIQLIRHHLSRALPGESGWLRGLVDARLAPALCTSPRRQPACSAWPRCSAG